MLLSLQKKYIEENAATQLSHIQNLDSLTMKIKSDMHAVIALTHAHNLISAYMLIS